MTGIELPAPVRPQRDHASFVTYAQITVYGWLLYAFGPSVPLLRDEEGMSNRVAVLHGTLFAIAGIIVSLLSPRIARSLGRGKSLRTGAVMIAAGMVVYCSGLPLAVTLAGAFLTGLGAGLVVVFANAHLNAHQGVAAPAAIAEATGLSALAGMVAPVALGLGVAIGWGWRPGFLVAAAAFVLIEFVRGPREAFNDGEHVGVREQVTLPARYWVACITLAFLVAVEFSLIYWSSDLLRLRGGVGSGAAALSVTAVVAGMALGRGAGAVFARRLRPESLLIAVIVLTLIGVSAAWLATGYIPVMLMLFVTGCGIGMHWPLGISRAVRASGSHADHAVSYAAAIVGIASASAPFVLGWIADVSGVRTAFLVVPVFLIVALVLVIVNRIPVDLSSSEPNAVPPV